MFDDTNTDISRKLSRRGIQLYGPWTVNVPIKIFIFFNILEALIIFQKIKMTFQNPKKYPKTITSYENIQMTIWSNMFKIQPAKPVYYNQTWIWAYALKNLQGFQNSKKVQNFPKKRKKDLKIFGSLKDLKKIWKIWKVAII